MLKAETEIELVEINLAVAKAIGGVDRTIDVWNPSTDLNDAFSEPFWDDPTALLRERALERRLNMSRWPRAGG